MKVWHTLEALYDADSRILILGTMPSVKSRELGFYYAHPQNRFWKIMAHYFDEPLKTKEERIAFCHRHHIALFDVLQSCEIKGSSDSSIQKAVPNDLRPILNTANITAIFTTGKKAYDLYQRYLKQQTGMDAILLPSTSPANAQKSLEALIEDYQVILKFL